VVSWELLPEHLLFEGHSLHLGVDSFLGMPFAKAGRLENPRLVNAEQDKLEGTQNATTYGNACPQSQFTSVSSDTKVRSSLEATMVARRTYRYIR
jgi:carboxylesterase type B